MDLKLKKIYSYGEDKSLLFISIEAVYGWENEMYGDIIKINYNMKKRDAYLTVKIKNPGIAVITEKIIELLTKINISDNSLKNPPLVIIERMGEILGMEYDPKMVIDELELSR
ncbi:hypothetical protein ACFL20_10640 [Spirochaetota bacterium]